MRIDYAEQPSFIRTQRPVRRQTCDHCGAPVGRFPRSSYDGPVACRSEECRAAALRDDGADGDDARQRYAEDRYAEERAEGRA